MKIRETFQIESPHASVWEFIVDPFKIGACLPSVESVQIVDDRHYKAIVKQKVGFISATFEIHTEVLERTAPLRLVLSNKGKTISGADGRLHSKDTITLKALSDRLTEVNLESELILGGKLAVLGAKMIEAKSKEIFTEATNNLRARLEGVEPAAAPAGKLRVLLRSLMLRLRGLLPKKWTEDAPNRG